MALSLLNRAILKVLPRSIIAYLHENTLQGGRIYFSQEGEDILLERFLAGRKCGFFIDVGAHHPVRYSNTYKFYLRGWRGINIDAMPGSMAAFRRLRPEDINLEIPVSDIASELVYFKFNDPALNTFSEAEAEKKKKNERYYVVGRDTLRTERLDTLLDRYVPADTKIDFMSVDVEGLDLQVLKSNNWDRYRPEFLLVEDLGGDINTLFSSETFRFIHSKGYWPVARTYNTVFFRTGKEECDT